MAIHAIKKYRGMIVSDSATSVRELFVCVCVRVAFYCVDTFDDAICRHLHKNGLGQSIRNKHKYTSCNECVHLCIQQFTT